MRGQLAWIIAALAAPTVALAQPVSGPYVSLGAGVGLQQDEIAKANPALGRPNNNFWSFSPGFSGQISLGYGFGNGLRAELEGDFLSNDVKQYFPTAVSNHAHGTERKFGGMANVLYDLPIGLPVVPYAGLGLGGQACSKSRFGEAPVGFVFPANAPASRRSQTVPALAYQAIVGAALPIDDLPGLSITAEYRFMGLFDGYPSFDRTVVFADGASASGRVRFGNDYNHSFLIGLRYAFGAPAPAVVAAPPSPAPAPVATPARTYLVFFDWDKSDLTPRARQIVAEAAAAATKVALTRIEVSGHADLSGTHPYNQALSRRRADSVAAELVNLGVPKGEIVVQAFGDTHPLVPTAAGVREPQNRRVEIVFR